MKIGLFGNTNNYPLYLTLLLRERGHSAFLVLTEKELLHRPESYDKTFASGYPEWILDLSYLNEWDFMSLHPDLAFALERLQQCDALLLNGIGPSLLPILNKPAIALLTGSDLSDYANLSSVANRTLNWDKLYVDSLDGKSKISILSDFITRQRLGIMNSIAVRYYQRGVVPEDDLLLDELGITDSRRYQFYLYNLKQLDLIQLPFNQRTRVFSGARLTWKLPIEPGRSRLDYKGSDVMIRGIGQFYRETGTKLDIRLVRKGLHIRETEMLILEEGLSDQVTWSDELTLTQFWDEIAQADIVFDQLADSAPGGSCYDAMAIGRPVIVNAREDLHEFPEPLAICQAKTPDEVCAQLKRLVFNAKERESIARRGRTQIETFINYKQTINLLENILLEAVNNSSKLQKSFNVGYYHFLTTLKDLVETRKQVSSTLNDLAETRKQVSSTLNDLAETRKQFDLAKIEVDITRNLLSDYLLSYMSLKANKIKKIKLKLPYKHDGGFAWMLNLDKLSKIADNSKYPIQSNLMLFENNQLLTFSHSTHDDIRSLGFGRYSHWENMLYFSSTDGSDPNTNGRKYQAIYISDK